MCSTARKRLLMNSHLKRTESCTTFLLITSIGNADQVHPARGKLEENPASSDADSILRNRFRHRWTWPRLAVDRMSSYKNYLSSSSRVDTALGPGGAGKSYIANALLCYGRSKAIMGIACGPTRVSALKTHLRTSRVSWESLQNPSRLRCRRHVMNTPSICLAGFCSRAYKCNYQWKIYSLRSKVYLVVPSNPR